MTLSLPLPWHPICAESHVGRMSSFAQLSDFRFVGFDECSQVVRLGDESPPSLVQFRALKFVRFTSIRFVRSVLRPQIHALPMFFG